MRARERLGSVTDGLSPTPLLVLFGLNFVDELDQILFGLAGPEIRDDLGLSDGGIVFVAALVAVFVLFAVLPITHIADRIDRVRLVTLAALGWMSMSVLTGLSGYAGLVVLLVIARMGSGLGRTVNDPVHASLLADYYPPGVLPRVFEVHRAANPISRGTAVLIGAGAGVLGWQAMFLVLAVPTLFLIRAASRLPEPMRAGAGDHGSAADGSRDGGTEPGERAGDGGVADRGAAAGADPAPAPAPAAGAAAAPAAGAAPASAAHLTLREARRVLFAIPSMRRLYLGAFLLGFGFLTVASFSGLFFEDVYDFSPTMRGVQAFCAGIGTLVGLRIGQRLASRALASGQVSKLATITGFSFTAGAAGMVLMAAMPFAAGSVLCSMLATCGFAAFQPAYYPLVALVTPARIRTQAYGWSLIMVGAGGMLGSTFVGPLADSSYRSAAVAIGCMVALAGLCGASAARLVAADVGAAAGGGDAPPPPPVSAPAPVDPVVRPAEA